MLSTITTTFVAPPAQAQGQPGAAAPPAQLGNVTVTAERRTENIRDVPISITTLSGEKLDVLNAGGDDIRLMSGRVPSLNIESSFGRAFPRFYLRGLGNTDFDLNASQPVSLVYDDVVLENPLLKGFPLFDLEQVEVLRGPQGTLFGRNSPAGVVKFDSVQPVRRREGYLNLGVGSHASLNLEGAVNTPLGADWAARASLLAQRRSDWVDNTYPGPTGALEGYNDRAARVQLLYRPHADFSALFNLHGRELDGTARVFRANIIRPGSNELVDGFDEDQVSIDGRNEQELSHRGGSLRLRWKLQDLTLHSVTGYETVEAYSRGDVDGGYGAVFAPPSGPGAIPFPAESADGLPDHKQISQEFRLQSNHTDSPLNWLAGAYYFHEDISVDSFNYDTLGGGVQNGYAIQQQKNRAWALFGSLNYAATERLKLRGGLRYTDDKKDFQAQRLASPIGAGPTGVLRERPRDHDVSWDLSGTYAVAPATNLYARLARGFRAPSIQGRLLFGDTPSVAQSERVLSYEMGVKADLFDQRARVGFNVYQYTVRDQQLTAVGGETNFNRLVNADKMVGRGAEVDLQALLTDRLQMTLGASYNHTELRDPSLAIAACGSGCTVTDPLNAAGLALIDGNPLPQAPQWIANVTLRYGIPTEAGEWFVYTDWAWRSKINFFLYESKEYTGKPLLVGGLRAGYVWGDGRYELALFGRNILNATRVVGGIDFNNLTGFINEPRTWGAQLKAAF
ncbi:TonB-dependent receptor [Caldimonas brevitalea]|uniref:TonB-dependent receptor n=1 Tax=Caldimonas brevitalea TaxID=413882 RepID=A0A0G3BJ47_9BURK|nr:TonB-dependent receptor [Caldimonas brevitalea]AKJ27386.1 TonB-dependent receptor [Caldimonas brevitalea]